MSYVTDPAHVRIFDTTLRDGEQSPGASMTLEEKLKVAEALEAMGVDVIEAGFPIASNGDFEAVRRDQQARQERGRLRACARRLQGHRPRRRSAEARRAARRIHTFISHQPRAHEAQAADGARMRCWMRWAPRSRARAIIPTMSSGAPKMPRAPSLTSCAAASSSPSRSGATTINIPDTVGYSTPEEYRELIRMLMERVPNADKVVFSTHCHNDLGLAVANSLAGVRAARARSNARSTASASAPAMPRLEEVVMALQGAPRRDAVHRPRSIPSSSRAPPRWSARSPAFRCNTTRRSSARTLSRMKAAFIRTACSRHVETYEIMTAGGCRREGDLARAGQALRPPCVPRQARGAGL